MDDLFLKTLIAYFAANNVAPEEVKKTDINREKSYLYNLPDNKDDPDFVFCFRNYHTRHATLVPKNVAVKYIQVLVRHRVQSLAFSNIQKLYLFILRQTSFDNTDGELIHYLDTTTWAIFDCKNGPTELQMDERGRHIWSLSFPVKTNIF